MSNEDLFGQGQDAGGGRVGTAPAAGAYRSAEYGGGPEGTGVDAYRKRARDEMASNDVQQANNASALGTSLANMQADRGQMSPTNVALSGREAKTRGEQGRVLDLSRIAAQGGGPSAADFNTRIGMNNAASGYASGAGGARGLAGLSGAQLGGAQLAGSTAGQLAGQGGMDRSKEIGSAIGMYGSQAGQMRGQDLTTLGASNQNAQFNAGLNDEWKLGNANLAIGQADLGNMQQGMDQQWFGESMKPADIQFQMDQERQSQIAGGESGRVAAELAQNEAKSQENQALVGGITQTGLTAVGSLGGPVGAAAGGMAGTAINSATKKYY